MRLRVGEGFGYSEGIALRLESATETDFRRIGSAFLSTSQYPYDISDNDMIKDFSATPLVLKLLYRDLVLAGLPETSTPLHLLWWLYYTKHYPKKGMWERISRRSYKTTKKWMHVIRMTVMVIVPDVVRFISAYAFKSFYILKYFSYQSYPTLY
jgi:hypothetical protein